MKTTSLKLTTACALAFAMASGAQAQILANDPFLTGGSGYTVGGVNGQGPAVTGFIGNWFQDVNPGLISATPISYSGTTGYEVAAGSGALVNNQDARNGRALDPSVVNAFTATSGTIYMSFLMQFGSVGGYQAVELGDNTDGGRFLQLGYSIFPDFQNSTDFGITLNASGGGGTSGIFGAADVNAHLFILQLNLTSGTDTLNAWEDPTSVTGGVVTGGTEVSLSGFTVVNTPSNFLLASFLGGSAGTEVSDVRIGNTLSDVTALAGISLAQITGGDAGEGFAPLPIDVAGVTFDSPTVTIQGVTFVQNQNGQTGEGGIDSTGVFPVPQSFGFGSTSDDNSMATFLSGSTYAYTGNTQYSSIVSGDKYAQYQFTGLTLGQTYQVDIFTVCDAIPRPTLTQVVGATTNAYIVETETSPQDVVYDMTPDTNGDITVEWTFGSGAYTQNSNGNSGCVSGIALTTQPASAPTLGVARSGSSLILTWSAGSTLLQATNLIGPWTTNVNTSPYTNIPIGSQMFFRVRTP